MRQNVSLDDSGEQSLDYELAGTYLMSSLRILFSKVL